MQHVLTSDLLCTFYIAILQCMICNHAYLWVWSAVGYPVVRLADLEKGQSDRQQNELEILTHSPIFCSLLITINIKPQKHFIKPQKHRFPWWSSNCPRYFLKLCLCRLLRHQLGLPGKACCWFQHVAPYGVSSATKQKTICASLLDHSVALLVAMRIDSLK